MSGARLRSAMAALLALVAGSGHGAGSMVEIAWSAEGRFGHAADVPAGALVEVCGRLDAGQAVRWRFDASAPLDFNIHYHAGREVVYPVRAKQVARAADRLRVTKPQDYCWMWTNKGPRRATLRLTLAR